MQEDNNKIKDEIHSLRNSLLKADKAYYVDSSPIMSDAEYDKLFDRLLSLEQEYPEFYDANSPTVRVGSDIDSTLPEREHSIPILSLDKCYSLDDLMDWINKIKAKLTNEVEIVIEPKIDGAGVVLYYENGRLDRVLTRGNGFFGNEITENIKTIRSVPLFIDDKDSLAVRGEVFIKKDEFKIFNEKYAEGKYSNPRNLASGSMKRQKSKKTALFPLNILIYEGFYEKSKINNHIGILINLKKLGFPLNDNLGFFSDNIDSARSQPFKNAKGGKIDDIPEYIEHFKSIRNDLQYEIDGLVIKINDIESREKLGYTQHHPRWAIAYKFDAPLAETILTSIDVQIGRGGRVTPVANLKPVELSGSIISRAPLHNQEYIDSLGVNEGDTVTISKRGDVIPAVEEVVEKGEHVSSYKITRECPVCNFKLIEDGAHLFCPNDECNGRLLGTLQYFVSRGQMDIESLGDKTIEFLFQKGFIRYISDIYEFDYNRLLEFEGYKEKKVNNIIEAVEKSKQKDFKTLLASLGLKDIGNKASELLIERYKNIDNILPDVRNEDIDKLITIQGVGEGIAKSIISHFNNPKVLNIIERLKKAGLKFSYEEDSQIIKEKQFLSGTKWVITGSFENYKPRDKAGDLIKKYGGEVISIVSSKTTHLLCGEAPGSKLNKAKALGVMMINEDEFIRIIENGKL